MNNLSIGSIFFDIGDTLATASITDGGARLVLTVLPGVVSVLTTLRENSIPLGIISNTPDNFTQAMMERSLARYWVIEFFLTRTSDLQFSSRSEKKLRDDFLLCGRLCWLST